MLLRLDLSNVPANPALHLNGDYPLAWAKMYGKGRVFYRVVRACLRDVGYPQRATDVFRGDALGAGADGCHPISARHAAGRDEVN